jgi:hypothetical protein
MLSVANERIMLGAIMMSAIMLNVAAPLRGNHLEHVNGF